jgi:alkaline phosphatase D
MKTLSVLLSTLACVHAAPIPLRNPSAEINSNINGTSVSDPSVIGWEGEGTLSEGNITYGNGRWKLRFEDSQSVRQRTSHVIEAGAAYSLRFDAALNATPFSQPANVLVGGSRLNGNFNADSSATDARTFAETPDWFNLAGSQNVPATRMTGALPSDGTRNAVVSDSGTLRFALDTKHDLTAGDVLQVAYEWRDALDWDDASDQIRVTLFITSDDTVTGTRTDLQSLVSGFSLIDSTYETFSGTFSAAPASADGKRLFVFFEGVDGNATPNGFARVDNFVLKIFEPLLIGPGTRNGDFNDDISATDSRSFNDTPFWTNITGAQTGEATRTNILLDGTRNAVLRQNTPNTFANDTEYTLATGDVVSVSMVWRDASNWTDAADRIAVFLYTTNDNTITGTRNILETLYTPLSTADSAWETFSADFAPISATASGKRLFAAFTTDDGDGNAAGFGRVENVLLSVNDSTPGIPDPPTAADSVSIVADVYVDNLGTPLVMASRTFLLKSQREHQWNHYHFAIPAGTLDAFEGKVIGVRFRGTDDAEGIFISVDNVRLDWYPADSPDGSFSNNWDTAPNRVWPGAGYWGNRLHDWQVDKGRVNCILGNLARRTLHRVGTSLRGNGEDFTLSVRTGLHGGSVVTDSKAGILIGAGPNLDWRGSLLVHDGLGRDFGTFLGLNGNGAAVIDDLSTGAVNSVASGVTPAGGLRAASRLALQADYNASTGEYTLTIQSFDASNVLLSTATTKVPSDRVLGSFGLLSHPGSGGDARFWFDEFSGSGGALQPEPDRSLAIIGALHSLNRGVLKMTVQLPAVAIASTPPVTFETWNGDSWKILATALVDATDNLSAYNATFEIDPWDDSRDTPYRVGVVVDGSTYYWEGTVRHDPVEKDEIVVVNTSCQRIADGSVQNDGIDWSPTMIWHPHTLAFDHIAKFQPDVLLALGDQIYEGQPTFKDTTSAFAQHHDYLYKWYLWMLEARDLAKDLPTISIPDDHDVYQGNLWGEGGIATSDQRTGGYESPPSWVRLVDRTQTSHMPAPDPYNPTQPAPSIAQGINVYFTELSYGEVGFAVLEDRKFKTGSLDYPLDPSEQVLLGQRQEDFLKAWSIDWIGQKVKCVVSQSPLGMIHTHAAEGYNFGLNDRDTHGWPAHRRKEAWELFRLSRSFQLAGDQHIGTLVHHGVDGPADAGYSFTSPAISNFFPRCWDPVHNTSGRTNAVSPYKGDFYLDGNGTLPSGEPNLTSQFPGHIRVIGAANPLEYYNQTRNIDPPNLHDRSAGYGIVRIKKATRQITFEAWPLHADPEFPQSGSQFPDWPVTINQTDNDGRMPTGFLPVLDTLSEKTPVVSVYDETTGELVYSMRFPGNLVRPPVYDNVPTYRVDISYGDDPVSEIRQNQTAFPGGPAAIHSFSALHPAIITGDASTLQWNVEAVSTLTIDHGAGDVSRHTVNGVGHLLVSPTSDTIYTLTLNGILTRQATVRVFPTEASWLATHFPAGGMSGANDDPDGDSFTNAEEFQFQTDPNNARSIPILASEVAQASGTVTIDFTSAFPLRSDQCTLRVESSADLQNWFILPSNTYREIDRTNNPTEGTTQITVRLAESIANQAGYYYRALWQLH